MIPFVSVAKAIIDRYGLTVFMFGLWLLIMVVFAVSMYVLDKAGAILLSMKPLIATVIRFNVPMGAIFSWASWIIGCGAGFLCIYALCVRISRSKEDPLFAPMTTLLLFVFLFRLFLSVPGVKKTVILMLLDPSGISQLIMVIMLIGLGICCFQLFSLRKEYRGFVRVRSQIEGLLLNSENQLDAIKAVLDQSQGLLKRKWINLKDSIAYAHHPDFDTLADFPDQREILKEGKISFIIKILPVLGIIGTVAGFTLAVVGMLDAASNMNDFYNFKGNLIASLGGMKSAFLTTLAGMVAMIIVMWINSVIEESRRRVLLIEAEFLYVRVFLPWLWLIRESPPSFR